MIHNVSFGAVPSACCLSASSASASAAAAAAAAAAGSLPPSAPPCTTKRDFQFRVIQVCQGPKWFIWPSLNQSQRKDKTDNNNKKEHNNNTNHHHVDNNNNNHNHNDNNNNGNNEARPLRAKAMEKPPQLNLDSGYMTGGCNSDPETIVTIFSPPSPCTPPTFAQMSTASSPGRNGGISAMKQHTVPIHHPTVSSATAAASPAEPSQYEARFRELASRLQAIQRTISLPSGPSAASATPSPSSTSQPAGILSAEPRCASVGAFEILAVSRKNDNEIDEEDEEEDELGDVPVDLENEEEDNRFGDSGYGGSSTIIYYSKRAVCVCPPAAGYGMCCLPPPPPPPASL